MHFSAENNLVCTTGFKCLFYIGSHRGAYERSDGSDVITKPKFLALMGLPKSLSYGAPRGKISLMSPHISFK